MKNLANSLGLILTMISNLKNNNQVIYLANFSKYFHIKNQINNQY